ncbi:protein of unknown function [Burkholderia multivorans]
MLVEQLRRQVRIRLPDQFAKTASVLATRPRVHELPSLLVRVADRAQPADLGMCTAVQVEVRLMQAFPFNVVGDRSFFGAEQGQDLTSPWGSLPFGRDGLQAAGTASSVPPDTEEHVCRSLDRNRGDPACQALLPGTQEIATDAYLAVAQFQEFVYQGPHCGEHDPLIRLLMGQELPRCIEHMVRETRSPRLEGEIGRLPQFGPFQGARKGRRPRESQDAMV